MQIVIVVLMLAVMLGVFIMINITNITRVGSIYMVYLELLNILVGRRVYGAYTLFEIRTEMQRM
jgi:hypothetical protein